MTEEPEKKPQTEAAETEADQAKGKSPLLKYLMFGGGGLVLIVAIAFGTLMLLGGDKTPAADPVETEVDSTSTALDHEGRLASHDQPQHAPESPENAGLAEMDQEDMLESLLSSGDDKFIDQIMDNLAFLDDAPDESEIGLDAVEQSRQDSLAQVHWLDQEKAALAARETDLVQREKVLAKLDREVTQKLLKVEQAETSRISNLAKLYDGMDPRSVAELMANLDDETVVALLPRMKAKNASAVMALMPAKRGAKLSKQMITIAGN
ncbi:MAG: hypothetical protein ABIE70_12295 [bacterium]